MKVLITGSHGFVGTNLIEVLSGEHEIIRWDIRTDEVLPECDAVIHLAGKAHDTRNTTQEDEYFKVNTELTKKIYDKFLRSETKKFIFFSSIKAKDNDTPYARSKYLAEQYILSHTNSLISRVWRCEVTDSTDYYKGHAEIAESAEYKTNTDFTDYTDKKVYILRPCMIHGKGVKGNLPLLFKFVKKGWPWPLAAFENQRSYASMGNVIYVVSELLGKDVASGTYNICDDEPVSTNDLIRLMSENLGHETKMLNIPKPIVRFAAKIGDTLHLPLNTERLRKLTGDYIVDNSKIKYALGINHMPVKAMDGLKFAFQELIKKEGKR